MNYMSKTEKEEKKRMRKRGGVLILMLAAFLLMTACGQNGEVTKRIVSENKLDVLLQECESVYFRNEYYGGLGQDGYFTKDMSYCEYDDSSEIITESEDWVYYPDQDSVNRYWYIMTDEEKAAIKPKPTSFLLAGKETTEGKVIRVTDNSDHTTTIETKINAGNSVKLLREWYTDLPDEFYKHDIECVYVVDTETYRLHSFQWLLNTGDQKVILRDSTLTYGAEMPSVVKDLLEKRDAYEALAKNPQTKKIVTIYYDAGTKYEEKFTSTVDQQCILRTIFREGFMPDDEKTERVTDEDGTLHVTMYMHRVD